MFEEPAVLGSTNNQKEMKVEGTKGVKVEETTNQPTKWDRIKYIEEYKLYLKNQERLADTLIALYNVV